MTKYQKLFYEIKKTNDYKTVGNIPIDEFDKATSDYWNYKWIIRGWSFGSAMAKIAERHFLY